MLLPSPKSRLDEYQLMVVGWRGEGRVSLLAASINLSLQQELNKTDHLNAQESLLRES